MNPLVISLISTAFAVGFNAFVTVVLTRTMRREAWQSGFDMGFRRAEEIMALTLDKMEKSSG